LPEEIDRIILDALPIQRTHGHDRQLRARFLFELRAQRLQTRLLLRADDSRQICDIARGMNALDVFGTRENRAKKRGAQQGSSSKKKDSAHLGIGLVRLASSISYVALAPKISCHAPFRCCSVSRTQ